MKKRILGFLLILMFSSLQALAAQEWSEAIDLGPGETPDFDIDPATGNIHLIYNNSGSVYTVLSPQGTVLSSEKIPRASGEKSWGGFYFGPSIAFDPATGRPHVVFRIHRGNWTFDIFYTYKMENGDWSPSLKLVDKQYRAYLARIDVDSKGVAHVLTGKSDGNNDIFGSATYYKIVNGRIQRKQENLDRYRADDRLEISISQDDVLHILLCSPDRSHQGIAGGPLTYWRSFDGGETLEKAGDIHSKDAVDRNGNADIFADQSGNVHIVYGAAKDKALENDRTLRYIRFENGEQVRDIVLTDKFELGEWQHSLGKGNVAASDDGQYVVATYNQADSTNLRSRYSSDGGVTWSEYVTLAGDTRRTDGREKEVLKAWQTMFYVVYPIDGQLFFRNAQFEYPPTAVANGPYTAVEGDSVEFDASASFSPDGKTIVSYSWDWDNDGTFDETSGQPQTKRFFGDDFTGEITLGVIDTDGLLGKKTYTVTITNALPVLSTGSPYHTIKDKPVILRASVSDAGIFDTHEFSWDLDGDDIFETPGAEATKAYADSGSYKVAVKVIDDDGGETQSEVLILVNNSRPIISAIPSQTIAEGGLFQDIILNQFVTHPDYPNSDLSWSFTGNHALLVSISDSTASIAVPDSEWAGAENILFTATDPAGNTDSASASFIVTAVNDAPVFRQIEEQAAPPGEAFAPLDLKPYISDIDDAMETLSVSAGPSTNFFIGFVGFTATIAPLNSQWRGSELVTFTVSDQQGASSDIDVLISVKDPSAVGESFTAVPDKFQLKMNYPNPFNPQTTIPFDLKEQATVHLEIYNVQGRRVATLLSAVMPAGSHKLAWDAQSVASGTYFVLLRVTKNARQVYFAKEKMLLIR